MFKILKTFVILKALASVVIICYITSTSCGGSGEEKAHLSAETTKGDSAGRADAKTMLSYPENSMEREGMILEIRTRETRLRASGFSEEADAYINAVKDEFDNASYTISTQP